MLMFNELWMFRNLIEISVHFYISPMDFIACVVAFAADQIRNASRINFDLDFSSALSSKCYSPFEV
jgi:hypothetical protein